MPTSQADRIYWVSAISSRCSTLDRARFAGDGARAKALKYYRELKKREGVACVHLSREMGGRLKPLKSCEIGEGIGPAKVGMTA